MPAIPVLRTMCRRIKFEASWGYMARPCLRKKIKVAGRTGS
jgi:hypothetical protein